MTPAQANPTPPVSEPDRGAHVEQVVARTLARRRAGEHLPDARVLADHPHLLPDLARSLRTAGAIHRAYLEARRAGVASTADALRVLSDDELDAPITDPAAAVDRLTSVPPHLDGYEILDELPRGTQGVVYLARQQSTGRRVAVKVLTDGRSATARARRRFDREADVLAALDHPHLVSVLDAGRTADGAPFLVMPYVDGLPLDEHLADAPGLGGAPAGPVLALFERLAGAAHAAHAAGVVHRDLKPSNIRVDRHGQPRILDFGLARLSDPTDGSPGVADPGVSATLTGVRQVVGSPAWMSPEQAAGAGDAVDARSDVYALGVMLYEALAGLPPYPMGGPSHVVLRHVLGTAPAPPSRSPSARPGCDRWVDAVVLKCLAKDPPDRYPTAAALADDLARCRAGLRPWAARRSPWSDRLARSRWAIAAVAALALFAWEASDLDLFGPGKPVVILAAQSVPPPAAAPASVPPIALSFIRAGSFLAVDPRTGQPARVSVPVSFWIGTTEVTRQQFAAVMGQPPVPPSTERLPATAVNRSAAVEFCRRVSRSQRRTCRLPTEAEWELAARAGDADPAAGDWFGSATTPDAVCWFAGNSGGQPHPVGVRAASRSGLVDMNGNVAEWCSDAAHGPPTRGVAVRRPVPTWGVVRGGSYTSPSDGCRNGAREVLPADILKPDVGFRVVFQGLNPPPAAG